jgi:tetratricopeptide (TPR) repeat protein
MKELEAALRIDEGRFREALILLDRALSLDSRRERRGRLLLSKAAVLGELHRKESALQALAQAEACLDRVEEPALWMRLRLEQVYFLCQSQRHHEAAPWLEEARELAARIGRDRERLQARLLGGWIAAASERSAEALEMLRGVAEELLAAHRVFDATAVEIDVAGLLAGMGRQTEVIELAGRLEARTARFPPQARTPLRVFCRLAQRGTLTADMARRLGTELRVAGGRLTRPYEIPI